MHGKQASQKSRSSGVRPQRRGRLTQERAPGLYLFALRCSIAATHAEARGTNGQVSETAEHAVFADADAGAFPRL